jgi:hypothetical protein
VNPEKLQIRLEINQTDPENEIRILFVKAIILSRKKYALMKLSSLSKYHLVPRHVCYRNARQKSHTVTDSFILPA